MAYLDITSKTASIMLNTDGTDNPDQLVGVAAAELFEWAWLIGELACWLEDAELASPTLKFFNAIVHGPFEREGEQRGHHGR